MSWGVRNMATPVSGFDRFSRSSRLPTAITLLALLGSLTIALPARSAVPMQAPNLSSRSGSAPIADQVAPSPEELGDLLMARRSYLAAIQAYLQVSPKSALVWNELGIAYQQMFLTEQARRSYEIALKIDPKNPNIMNNLGTIYFSLKRYGDAGRLYRKALRIDPKSPLIYKNLGTNLLAENKFKKGWECYEAALALDPETFERSNQLRIGEPTPPQERGAMNYYLAKSYVRAGMQDRAVGCLRMAIDEGFTDRKKVMADKEFATLRGFTPFEQLISERHMQ